MGRTPGRPHTTCAPALSLTPSRSTRWSRPNRASTNWATERADGASVAPTTGGTLGGIAPDAARNERAPSSGRRSSASSSPSSSSGGGQPGVTSMADLGRPHTTCASALHFFIQIKIPRPACTRSGPEHFDDGVMEDNHIPSCF